MNKFTSLITIIFLAHYLGAGEPPMQPAMLGMPHAQEVQEAQNKYMFDNNFLIKTSFACIMGAGLYTYAEYGMQNQSSLDRDDRSSIPVIAGVAGIKLLFAGCGGCMAYWQERLFSKEHTE